MCVGSEEVTTTLHEHFRAQFAAEGGHWHTDKEVDRAMRALFSDSYAGALAREQILQPGVWPRQLGPMCSVAAQKGRARLMEMCQLKEGADRIVHDDCLREITVEEWQEHWRNKSRRTSPGASGVGPDLWKEAPAWIQEMARRMYSACMKLKIMPDQWRVEIICPVSKSGSPVCRTEDLRPIKLLEVTKSAS